MLVGKNIAKQNNSLGLPTIIAQFARMYPREIYNHKIERSNGKPVNVARTLEILQRPGVYILYRDDRPYYIGKAARLNSRLYAHARRPGSKHDLFWNYFSVFVVEDAKHRAEVEAMLIAAIPTANGARPKLENHPYPDAVRRVMNLSQKGTLLKSAGKAGGG